MIIIMVLVSLKPMLWFFFFTHFMLALLNAAWEGKRQWLRQLVALKWRRDDIVCGSTVNEKRLLNHAPGFPQTLSVILGKSDWGKAFFFFG